MRLSAATAVLGAVYAGIASVVAGPRFSVTPTSLLSKSGVALDSILNDNADLATLYPVHKFTVAVDHFHNDSQYAPHTTATFPLRYWFDASHYQPGGPVVLLLGGETSGANRLIFMQKGILYELAKATNGLAVILEHRYYGASFPVANLSTTSLRFLTTAQALADTAAFAQTIVFPGLESQNLTATATPWIVYGGSYAGGMAAFLRKLYPDTFYGAIASSSVTAAITDFWQYFEPARKYGPARCIRNTQLLVAAMDAILTNPEHAYLIPELKSAFGFGGISHVQDFANVLAGYGVEGWQAIEWVPAYNDPLFYDFCDQLASSADLYNATAKKRAKVVDLLLHAGYASMLDQLVNPMLNWIGFILANAVRPCTDSGATLDDCFGSFDVQDYKADDITQTWRSWSYQTCTQWGYFTTGSGVPARQLPLISRTIDLNYTTHVCRWAFGLTSPPDTQAINQYGGEQISYPRLAFIGGQWDPWRPATPLAAGAKPWPGNTTSEPTYLIPRAVHHWDEYGLLPRETTPTLPPASVNAVHAFEVGFVGEWLVEAEGVFPRS